MTEPNKIKHAEYGRGGLTIVHEGDQADNFVLDTIRGGILWPAAESNGYLCVVGQRTKFNEAHKRPLVLLVEHVIYQPKEMIKTIASETTRMQCRAWYNDYSEQNAFFQDELDEHLKKFGFGQVIIDEPYLQDWITGVLSIKQWMADKSLDLSVQQWTADGTKVSGGSLLREQMSSMAFEDRDESRRGRFPAVDALRCVIGSFELPARAPLMIKQSRHVYT